MENRNTFFYIYGINLKTKKRGQQALKNCNSIPFIDSKPIFK